MLDDYYPIKQGEIGLKSNYPGVCIRNKKTANKVAIEHCTLHDMKIIMNSSIAELIMLDFLNESCLLYTSPSPRD